MSANNKVNLGAMVLNGLLSRAMLLVGLSLLSGYSQSVLALGLGDITMKSALGQPMRAEITLVGDPAELRSASVKLAAREHFEDSGIDYSSFVRSFRFSVKKGNQRDHLAIITTKDAVNEPFVQFVVELNWQGGQMRREYTVLVDPPEQAAPASPAPTPSTVDSTPAATVAAPQPNRIKPVLRKDGRIEYGPTQNNDTLYDIAHAVRFDTSHTIDQVMVAMQKANPDAFYQQNVNRLKAGYVLRVDDPALITAISAAEARNEIKRQTRRWQSGEPAPKVAQPVKPEPAKLRLSAPDAKELEQLTEESALLLDPSLDGEAAEVAERTGDVLQVEETPGEVATTESRLAKLESELQNMQKLVAVKDAEIAALQARLGSGSVASSPSTLPSPMLVMVLVLLVGGLVFYKLRQRRLQDQEAQPSAFDQDEFAALPQEEAKEIKLFGLSFKQPAFLNSLFKSKSDLQPITMIEPASQFQQVENTSHVRSEPEEVTPEVVATEEHRVIEEAPHAEETASKEEEPIAQPTTVSSNLLSDTSGIETEENDVDAMAEADVYIAYGRYRQAEDGLLRAIMAAPDRHELKVKLLEAYAAEENVDAFTNYAEEFFAVVGGEGEYWEQVRSFATEVCPDHPLFLDEASSLGMVAETEVAGRLPTVEDVSTLEADDDLIQALHADTEQAEVDEPEVNFYEAEETGSFDLAVQKSETKDEEHVLEFSLDGFDAESIGKPVVAREAESLTVDEEQDPSLSTVDKPASPEAPAVAEEGLDFDLDFDTVATVEEDNDFEFVLDDLPGDSEPTSSPATLQFEDAESVEDTSVEDFLAQSDDALTFVIEEEQEPADK